METPNYSDIRSNFDNCIFYNAILRNEDPYDDHEIGYLVEFSKNGLQSAVDDYFYRSERIIKKMRELGTDDDATWIDIDKVYINPIFQTSKDAVDAYKKTLNMLEGLETQYGVI